MSDVLMRQLFCHQQVEKPHDSRVLSGAAVVRLQSQSFTIIYLDTTWSRVTSGHSYNVICFISCFPSSSITWYWRTDNTPILKTGMHIFQKTSYTTIFNFIIKTTAHPHQSAFKFQNKAKFLSYFSGGQLIECKKLKIYTNERKKMQLLINCQ